MTDEREWPAHGIDATRDSGRIQALPQRLRLFVLSGPDRGAELELVDGTYYIGKHPHCALVLHDDQVSRRHLELRVGPSGVSARDLGSRNGSFYRGGRFAQIVVGNGAVLTIGKTELAVTETTPQFLPSEREAFGRLRGRSLAMRQLFGMLEVVAPSDAAVLLEGETGTGKEVCAEAIHAESARRDRPLVVCDLGAFSRGLIESELFGHAKGAFTDAQRERPGAFEVADGGTLFLDEIGELEKELQPRLLRAVERHQVCRIGETRHRNVDVRIIAATHRDLGEEVKAGRFREDLYHRLCVVRVRLPPLRERKEDLPLLVRSILGPDAQLSPETLTLLGEYDWPGNVRELGNTLERGLVVAGQRAIEPADLALKPASAGPPDAAVDFHASKERLIDGWERDFLARLLARNGHNLSQAARLSGLGRASLYRLLKKHKLE